MLACDKLPAMLGRDEHEATGFEPVGLAIDSHRACSANDGVDFFLPVLDVIVLRALAIGWQFELVDCERAHAEWLAESSKYAMARLDLVDVHDTMGHFDLPRLKTG
jgi:hypothetical protein